MFHAFVQKQSKFYQWQRRFIVLSKNWMYNVVADFETEQSKYLKTPVVFKEIQWRHPLTAIVKMVLEKKNEMVRLTVIFDVKKQEDILK